jgi:tetratricopeptide (TPR) repeat protein
VGKNRTGLNALHRDHPDKDTGAVGQHVELERLIDFLDKGRLTEAERKEVEEHLFRCRQCGALLSAFMLDEFASDSGERGLTDPERLASHPDHLGEEVEAAGQHVELERLTAYYEGRMTTAEREELQEHLSLCVRCSALLRELHEFASDSGERGLSGPEHLEQEAWELLVQSRPVATTERTGPMDRSSPAQPSRLLLRLVEAATDSRHLASLRRRSASGRDRDERVSSNAGDPPREQESGEGSLEEYPESFWERLHEVAARFEAELQFAGAFLEDNPTSPQVSMMLGNSSELRRVAFLQRLVEKAYSLRLNKPNQGLRILEDVLTWTQTDSSRLVSVFRARALMERGNFLRILGNPDSARKSFALAFDELENCAPNDPLEVARYQELLGTLEGYCGNYEAAADLLSKALAKVRWWGDQYSLQRILIAKAFTLMQSGEPELALKTLSEAEPFVSGQNEPRLLFCLRFNFAATLCDLGQFMEAQRCVSEITALAAETGNELDPVRALWLRGRIDSGLGRTQEAEAAFKQVWQAFRQRGVANDFAMVTLELVSLLSEQGRWSEVRSLAKETMWIFKAQGIHSEAEKALAFFCEMAAAERLTVELAQRILEYLSRAEKNLGLRFNE